MSHQSNVKTPFSKRCLAIFSHVSQSLSQNVIFFNNIASYSHSPLPTFFFKKQFQPLKTTPFSTLKEKQTKSQKTEKQIKQRLLPKLQCKKSHDEKEKKKTKNEEREREYLKIPASSKGGGGMYCSLTPKTVTSLLFVGARIVADAVSGGPTD